MEVRIPTKPFFPFLSVLFFVVVVVVSVLIIIIFPWLVSLYSFSDYVFLVINICSIFRNSLVKFRVF